MAKRRIFGDTNIIIRYLANDPSSQASIVEKFLAELQTKKIELYLLDLVIAEAVYVLQSYYKCPRDEITEKLSAFCAIPGVNVKDRQTVLLALNIYSTRNIDFTDAFLSAQIKLGKDKELFSFDKDFGAMDWIKNHEV